MNYFEKMKEAIENGEVSIAFDIEQKMPACMIFNFGFDGVAKLYPPTRPIVNPMTFTTETPARIIHTMTGARKTTSITSDEYNNILGVVEDKAGKTISELSFGVLKLYVAGENNET